MTQSYKIGQGVVARSDGAFVPFDMANTDSRRFLIDWRDGAPVTGDDGNPLSYSDDAVRALGLTPL